MKTRRFWAKFNKGVIPAEHFSLDGWHGHSPRQENELSGNALPGLWSFGDHFISISYKQLRIHSWCLYIFKYILNDIDGYTKHPTERLYCMQLNM